MSMIVKIERAALLGSRAKAFENLAYFRTAVPLVVEALFECDTRDLLGVMGPTATALGAHLPLMPGIPRGEMRNLSNGLGRMRELRTDLLELIEIERRTSVNAMIEKTQRVDRCEKLPWLMHADLGDNQCDSLAQRQMVGWVQRMQAKSVLFVQLPWEGSEPTQSMTQSMCRPLWNRLEGVSVGVVTLLPTQMHVLQEVVRKGLDVLPPEQRIEAYAVSSASAA